MSDEIVDDVEVEEPLAEPDSDAASQTDNELPDDPEELKIRLKAAETAKADAEREAARAKRKNERLEESVKEERKGKDYWYNEASRQTSERLNADTRTDNGSTGKPAQGRQNLKDALSDINILDYVGGKDESGNPAPGTPELIEELEKRGVIVTAKRLEAVLNEREEQNRKATNLFGSLTARFPDLNDLDSELAQETTERAKRLIENEGMDAPAAYRIAAAEAALDLGVKPKEKAKREPAPAANGNRLRNAQGGPVSKSNTQPAKIVVSEDIIKDGMKMGLTREAVIRAQTRRIQRQRQLESSQSRRV